MWLNMGSVTGLLKADLSEKLIDYWTLLPARAGCALRAGYFLLVPVVQFPVWEYMFL